MTGEDRPLLGQNFVNDVTLLGEITGMRLPAWAHDFPFSDDDAGSWSR